jgi:hypothetical protein
LRQMVGEAEGAIVGTDERDDCGVDLARALLVRLACAVDDAEQRHLLPALAVLAHHCPLLRVC